MILIVCQERHGRQDFPTIYQTKCLVPSLVQDLAQDLDPGLVRVAVAQRDWARGKSPKRVRVQVESEPRCADSSGPTARAKVGVP
jgi:hypothetical protein